MKTSFALEGYEQIKKTVRASGNSGRIYLPVSWIGCRVAIIRLDELVGFEEVTE